MKKRVISLTLAFVFLLALAPVAHAEARSYWAWQKDWLARDTEDDDATILLVEELVNEVYPNPTTASEYTRIMDPAVKAANAYERKTMFDKAAKFYELSIECYTWLTENNGEDHEEEIKLSAAAARLDRGAFTLYAEATEPDIPYYGAINEPEKGTILGTSGDKNEWATIESSTGYILYVHFATESISSFSWQIPDDADVIEVAWNMPDEKNAKVLLDEIANGEWDSYIMESLQFLKSLDKKILLRFGAEVNTWSELPQNRASYESKGEAYCQSFISAFQRVATLTHKNAPNCAMVYSPNDVSNWYFTVEDFYPGDEYVDWVGMSTYGNFSAEGELGNRTDAAYIRNAYADQIMRIEEIVEAFGDRKPIMVSECGFAYASSESVVSEETALERMTYFYTYITMVYPQVKAVFYFNTNSAKNTYKLTGENGNATMRERYEKLVAANASMQAYLHPENATYYTALGTFSETADSLKLTAYAYYPGNLDKTVTYTLDGKQVGRSSQYPYSVTISNIKEGTHTLTATLNCGATEVTKTYTLYRGGDGILTVAEGEALADIKPSDYFYTPVAWAVARGITTGTDPGVFSPDETCTRGQIVTFLWRAFGKPEPHSTVSQFKDVTDPNEYFYKAVLWAVEQGITTGAEPDAFEPEEGCTRAQVVTFLWRAAGSPEPETTVNPFTDVKSGEFYYKAVLWAVEQGITTGAEPGYFEPEETCTRGQIVTFLYRFLVQKAN